MYRAGQLDKAQRLAEASLEQDPEDAGTHSMLAVILTERSRKSAAEGAGREGLRLSPDEEYSHLGAGLAYYGNGRPFMAKRHIREALRLNPDDADTIALFEEVDFHTRWTSILFYYWSWLVNKIPGRQFLVWAVVMVLIFTAAEVEPLRPFVMFIVIVYLLLVIYTWLAMPLTKLWVRVRPPR